VKTLQGSAVVTVSRDTPSDLVRLELADARLKLERSLQALKEDLTAVAVVRRSVVNHPVLWLAGAFAVGALFGKLSRRLTD
jgi:hypothetical protein